MKGYYIILYNTEINIRKKIDMQIDEFRKFSDVSQIELKIDAKRNIFDKIGFRIPFLHVRTYDFGEALKKIVNPDYVYMRRLAAEKEWMLFLQEIKKRYPKCKVIVEFFTYPYEKDEWDKISLIPIMLRDRLFRGLYSKCVDRIVTYSGDEIIFGVKTLRIINGIDVNKYPRKRIGNDSDDIHMLAVAMFQKHHGYERIINGIKEYYNKSKSRMNIKLYLVGEGDELELYRKIVNENNLGKYVEIFGLKDGSELDRIYDDSDIGLGSFGFYKAGFNVASSLKIREYLSKGIPVAVGVSQDIFALEPCEYYIEFDNNDSNVDIEKIIEFYKGLLDKYQTKKELSDRIHDYAAQNLTMAATFRPVTEYLKSIQ